MTDRRCDPQDLAREVQAVGGRLMMLFAAGERAAPELSALVASPSGVVRLRAVVTTGSYPALTPTISAAHWFEREIHDLFGIVPAGHPRLEPLVRHEADPGELSLPEADDPEPEHRGARRLSGPGVFVIPYGPVRSGVFEAVQYLVQTGGEDVAYCAQRLFFKRRGAERRVREVPLELAVLVAERVSGTSSVAHALAFSHAVESLSATEVPLRGQAIRRVLAELERLYNHLEVIVRECEDASLAVAQAQFAALKERLHRLAAELVGNRFLRGAIAPGGVRVDLGSESVRLIRDTLRGWEQDFRRTLAMLLRTDSFLDRLVSTGPLSEQDATDFGCVGPVARGSGVETDARREFPYDGYDRVVIAIHHDGDAMARMEVRFQEVETSLALIGAALDALPAGATRNAVGAFVADAALGVAESARGETLYWLQAQGPAAIGFCKLRAASFVNYGIFNRLFDAQVLTDFSFVEHSLGLSPAGCDA